MIFRVYVEGMLRGCGLEEPLNTFSTQYIVLHAKSHTQSATCKLLDFDPFGLILGRHNNERFSDRRVFDFWRQQLLMLGK